MHELPKIIRERMEEAVRDVPRRELIQAGQTLSLRYRQARGRKRTLHQKEEALAYLCARMPATYAACHAVLSEALAFLPVPERFCDCGAGTGAGALALWDLAGNVQTLCLEKEAEMQSLGMRMCRDLPVRYERADLSRTACPRSDWTLCAYVLGEMEEGERQRTLSMMWQSCRTLLLIEPGTPEGWQCLQKAAAQVVPLGARVLAPCRHFPCTLNGDWCHFSVRVARSQLHKQIKGGDAPYEDEKYTYMILTRSERTAEGDRIVRHPQVSSGRIALNLCTPQGLETRTVTKKDPLWKRARKCAWGELFGEEAGVPESRAQHIENDGADDGGKDRIDHAAGEL